MWEFELSEGGNEDQRMLWTGVKVFLGILSEIHGV